MYIFMYFLSRLLWSVIIKINRFEWFDRRTTIDPFEILKSYVMGWSVYEPSLMKNFVCQNFGDDKFIVASRWLYQWPRIVILMKPPFAICTEPLFDSDCVLFFKLNEHAGRCLTYTRKHTRRHTHTRRESERDEERKSVSERESIKKRKKKNCCVRLSNSIEKSGGSYYSVVFNWDLIDPSIIHCDCQWAVYAVYATSVSLSFPRILTTKYILCFSCFFFFCVAFLFILLLLCHPFISLWFRNLTRASFAMIRLHFRFPFETREKRNLAENIYIYIKDSCLSRFWVKFSLVQFIRALIHHGVKISIISCGGITCDSGRIKWGGERGETGKGMSRMSTVTTIN